MRIERKRLVRIVAEAGWRGTTIRTGYYAQTTALSLGGSKDLTCW